ncbi:MAG: FAD-binding oxidoreductase [bacterium]|nr:FAD-binding oxidoreductase [bacterium]
MQRITGSERILTEFPDYLRDESRLIASHADALVWPLSEDDIRDALADARAHAWPVTVSAARTGIVGGCVPLHGGMILSLDKMTMLSRLNYDLTHDSWSLVCQPGALLCGVHESAENLFRFYEPLWPADAQKNIQLARQRGVRLFYPPDPTELSATVGGSVATNASGARTFKYGPTRPYVRRLRVVLADGAVLDIPRGAVRASHGMLRIPDSLIALPTGHSYAIPVPSYSMPATKHCAGYFASPDMDLIDLFIGSEGTLGVISEVELLLLPRTKERLSVTAFFPSELRALQFVNELRSAIRNGTLDIEAIEFFGASALQLLRLRRTPSDSAIPEIPHADAAIYTELAYHEGALDEAFSLLEHYLVCCGSSADDAWAGLDDNEIKKMKLFRHAVPETINQIIAERKRNLPSLHKIATDLAVPDEHLQDMITFYHEQLIAAGLEYVIFGHIGNNHLHVNILPRDQDELLRAKILYRRFAEKAVALGGTVAAEHGIGKLKTSFLEAMYGPAGVAQMRAVKEALDPHYLLGRGTLFSPPSSD